MDDSIGRMQILEMIESGRISAEEGIRLLQALSGDADTNEAEIGDAGSEIGGPVAGTTDLGAETPESASEVAIPLAPPAMEGASPEASLVEADLHSEPIDASLEPDLPAGAEALSSQESTSAGPNAGPEAARPAAAMPAEPGPAASQRPPSSPPDVGKWKHWWMFLLWIGLGISIFGGVFISLALHANPGFSFWLLCAIIPFTLGVLVMVLAWLSRQAPWLHVRVQQAPGETPQRIAISMPLPLGIIAWFFRNFGHYIPNTQDIPIADMIQALGKTASAENPIYIQVDEGEDGEKVEVFIG